VTVITTKVTCYFRIKFIMPMPMALALKTFMFKFKFAKIAVEEL
jgi:hypothetical protein